MASNVTLLKMVIGYWASGSFDTVMFVVFLTLSVLTLVALRKQIFVDESQWLKKMITHHSGAITTSKEIVKKTKESFRGWLSLMFSCWGVFFYLLAPQVFACCLWAVLFVFCVRSGEF